jgi:integrase
LRFYIYITLIGLLVSCGLRASEALRLLVSQVDLEADPPLLRILETKFRKSRVVPVHPTTAAALRGYAGQRRRLAKGPRLLLRFAPRWPVTMRPPADLPSSGSTPRHP